MPKQQAVELQPFFTIKLFSSQAEQDQSEAK